MSMASIHGVSPNPHFGILVINHGTRALTVSDNRQAVGGLNLAFFAHQHLIDTMTKTPAATKTLTAEPNTTDCGIPQPNHSIGLSFNRKQKEGILVQQDQAGNETKIVLPLETPNQRWVFEVMAGGIKHLPISETDKTDALKWVHDQLTDMGPVKLTAK